MHKTREGFTLLEVMVAVLIVSVVIAAIYEVKGNANTKLFWLKDTIKEVQYNTFLLGASDKYGFETSSVSLNELVADFDLESDLRRKLKSIKLRVSYDELDSIETPTGSVFEIGKTTMASKTFDTSILRVKLQ